MAPLPAHILIVGGGVFGLSTALSLSRRHPNSQVTLLEASPTIPNPHGSSVDSSRIIRADYSHSTYAKLATEATDLWRRTEWGRDGRYTQNGLLLVYPDGDSTAKDYTTKSYHNVKELGEDAQFLPTKADVLRAAPAYGETLNVAGGYVNWSSGWADAEAGVRFAKQRLDEQGKVCFLTGQVTRLLFSEKDNQTVTGVALANNTTVNADLVILATGAWTGALVDLRGRAVSTGQAIAYMRISDEEQRQLESMPTILNFATGIFIIPPRKNVLKIARHAYGYHNPKVVPVPGSATGETMNISLPEQGVPIPLEGETAFRTALGQLLPTFADRPFINTRICWYTDTPKGDFIVTAHPSYPHLFLATGGSGHAYKFFPVIGDKVVDALEGTLAPELRDLWAWPEAVDENKFKGTEDGSRSGAKGLLLLEELAKGRKAERKGVL
ncbi:Putative Fructosyl amino acid oxidasesarcosine oxidase [Aspergillus calidoustus]|uniref:Putative Fructosyl amino acid oxidasesarcosine oxidase n=1 Tax=Aspergillus calidoustus TaxID=454130 RepID=A0A0U5G7J6_ASPCI|nr:Putative Fructosyl amino acid oxidasesarcosine oxidase [Aspergillus calidoustus]